MIARSLSILVLVMMSASFNSKADLEDFFTGGDNYNNDGLRGNEWLNHGVSVGAISNIGPGRSEQALIQFDSEGTAYVLDFKIAFTADGEYIDVEFDTIALDLAFDQDFKNYYDENQLNKDGTENKNWGDYKGSFGGRIGTGFKIVGEFQKDTAIGMDNFNSVRILGVSGGFYGELADPGLIIALEAAVNFLGYGYAQSSDTGVSEDGLASGAEVMAGVIGSKFRVVLGGKWRQLRDGLFNSPEASRQKLFVRASYQVAPDWTIVAEVSDNQFEIADEEDSVTRGQLLVRWTPFKDFDRRGEIEAQRFYYGALPSLPMMRNSLFR